MKNKTILSILLIFAVLSESRQSTVKTNILNQSTCGLIQIKIDS